VVGVKNGEYSLNYFKRCTYYEVSTWDVVGGEGSKTVRVGFRFRAHPQMMHADRLTQPDFDNLFTQQSINLFFCRGQMLLPSPRCLAAHQSSFPIPKQHKRLRIIRIAVFLRQRTLSFDHLFPSPPTYTVSPLA
jgi:hypothetical protein